MYKFLLNAVSVGYTMDTMYFRPLDTPFDIADDLQLPQFHLINQTLIDCSQNYTTGTLQVIQYIGRRTGASGALQYIAAITAGKVSVVVSSNGRIGSITVLQKSYKLFRDIIGYNDSSAVFRYAV